MLVNLQGQQFFLNLQNLGTDTDKLKAVGDASGLNTTSNLGGLMDALDALSGANNKTANATATPATGNTTKPTNVTSDADKIKNLGNAMHMGTGSAFGGLLSGLSGL